MMSWPLIVISFAAKQSALYGLSNGMFVSVAIMLVYIAKFFWWESGYLKSIDIMVDRAGFYICWGCLVWVPSLYTIPAMYLVHHPYAFSTLTAGLILVAGLLSVAGNYLADLQRQRVRATQGNCTVWGSKPTVIHAQYTDHHGAVKNSLLLTSGYWGISRHFHYLLELSLAFFWTLPALFMDVTPWFYWLFLAVLLTHRSYRDDKKCALKYGEYWDLYCARVPNKIIPWARFQKHLTRARNLSAS
jgi:7-dehydrocholesterol reductase